MLLRAGLIYGLAVASLLLGALAAWQGVQLSALKEGMTTLVGHTERNQRRLDNTRLKAEEAERRALVAEDKLIRAGIPVTEDDAQQDTQQAASTYIDVVDVEKLRRDLAELERERDAARTEAHQLAGELEAVHKSSAQAVPDAGADTAARERDEAKSEVKKLSDELEDVRKSLIEARSAVGNGEAAHQEIQKLSAELEAARKSLSDDARVVGERDAARADVERLSRELEAAQKSLTQAQQAVGERDAARAEVLKLSGELETANETLAQAHQAARNLKNALAGIDARGTEREGALAVTAAPIASTPAAVAPPPADSAVENVNLDPKNPEGDGVPSPTGLDSAAGEASSSVAPAPAAPAPAPKRKEAKQKHRATKGRHIESSIFLPF